jgi:hypothetical protein
MLTLDPDERGHSWELRLALAMTRQDLCLTCPIQSQGNRPRVHAGLPREVPERPSLSRRDVPSLSADIGMVFAYHDM